MLLGGGKSRAALQAEASETNAMADPVLSPGLYITATPIGNAADITLRALNVLRNCDCIVAEDTRVTSRLLALYGISRPLLVYNDYNAASMRPKLLERLRQGARLALVSDAGTPLVSDPGHKLVRAAREEGLPVFPVPGASAVLAALTASGLPSDRFFFIGWINVGEAFHDNPPAFCCCSACGAFPIFCFWADLRCFRSRGTATLRLAADTGRGSPSPSPLAGALRCPRRRRDQARGRRRGGARRLLGLRGVRDRVPGHPSR
jgi:hypothetical protein